MDNEYDQNIKKLWPPGKPKRRARSRVQQLRDQGFDESTYNGNGGWSVRCSRCEALVINKVPTHEIGCSNAKKGRSGG